jgi:hypothetical protein
MHHDKVLLRLSAVSIAVCDLDLAEYTAAMPAPGGACCVCPGGFTNRGKVDGARTHAASACQTAHRRGTSGTRAILAQDIQLRGATVAL